MEIIYRRLQAEDTKAYRQIRLEALKLFPENFGSTYEEESAKPRLAFETYIEQQTPGKFITGAFYGDELVGICGFARDESLRNRHKGTIIQMYVRPQFAGRGIGLALLQNTVNDAFKLEGVEQLVLGVITTNLPAVRVYEKAGFTTFGLQHNYFKDGENYLHQQCMVLSR